jgi:hypothetical protein
MRSHFGCHYSREMDWNQASSDKSGVSPSLSVTLHHSPRAVLMLGNWLLGISSSLSSRRFFPALFARSHPVPQEDPTKLLWGSPASAIVLRSFGGVNLRRILALRRVIWTKRSGSTQIVVETAIWPVFDRVTWLRYIGRVCIQLVNWKGAQ